jgi:hypothetical protein
VPDGQWAAWGRAGEFQRCLQTRADVERQSSDVCSSSTKIGSACHTGAATAADESEHSGRSKSDTTSTAKFISDAMKTTKSIIILFTLEAAHIALAYYYPSNDQWLLQPNREANWG